MKHIFLSYASADGRDVARQLFNHLQQHRYDVWLDIYKIEPSADWNWAIDNAIRDTWLLCVVLTPGSVVSHQVRSEWIDAIDRHIPVIPILAQNCDVPRVLKTVNWIDFRDSFSAGMDILLSRIKKIPHDHYYYLKYQLDEFQKAQKVAPEPERFQQKVDAVSQMLKAWESTFKDVKSENLDNTSRQQQGTRVTIVGLRELLRSSLKE